MPATPTRRHRPKPTFSTVAVEVSDREKAIAWYTKSLGLDLLQRLDQQGGHWVTVGRKGRGGAIHLCQFSDFDPTFRVEPSDTGIQFHLAGDFRKACATLKKNGVRFSRPPKKMPWGWIAGIRDPDGNGFSLTPGK
jgi:predicted enzyme related to lactoylglutathione lyase